MLRDGISREKRQLTGSKQPQVKGRPYLATGGLDTSLDGPERDLGTKIHRSLSIEPTTTNVATMHLFVKFDQCLSMDYLPILYRDSGRSRAFEASFNAVAISHLANSRASSDLARQASRMYSTALHETNLALSCRRQAIQDHTLASILLLALYTVVSGSLSHDFRIWSTHVHGALMLMAQRPPEAFQDPTTQLLLSHLISALLFDCFKEKKRLPAVFRTLCSLSGQAKDGFQLQFWNLMADFLELQKGKAQEGTPDTATVQRAKELDRGIAALTATLPNHRQESMGPFLNFDKYSDRRQTYGWNVLRLIRMYTLEMRLTSSENYSPRRGEETVRDDVDSLNEAYRTTAEDTIKSLPDQVQIKALLSSSDNVVSWVCGLLWPVSQAIRSGMLAKDMVSQAQARMLLLSEHCDDRCISKTVRDVIIEHKTLDR